jgi:hypothetical protein
VTTNDDCISGADKSLFDVLPHKTTLGMTKFDHKLIDSQCKNLPAGQLGENNNKTGLRALIGASTHRSTNGVLFLAPQRITEHAHWPQQQNLTTNPRGNKQK